MISHPYDASPAPWFSPLRQPRVTADGDRSVTVAFHRGTILKPKTLEAILEKAGLSVDDFRDLP